jgi:asparagine synthase (glutamine-hydrolysing)
MCGIAGYFGRFSPWCLSRMSDSIAHRGPDSAGQWYDAVQGIGLAHRRLAIIDLSERGAQPMWDVGRRVCIVFNGEIYNFKELRLELEMDGYEFQSDCDTEVIINLYIRDGRKCLERLNGIFAFALWDVRARKLLVARDGLGVKPLYYARVPAGFVFASELKAVLQVPGVPVGVDSAAIASYLTFLFAPSPHTMLSGIRKLRPGHAIELSCEGKWDEWKFYELPYDQPISIMSVDEAVAQTRHFVKEAVKRQMVADVPVGAFLSGGLDSSSVVAFAREHLAGRKLACFSIGFDGEGSSSEGLSEDLPYAQRVARHLGVDLNVVTVSPSVGSELEQMVYQLDEPQADPAALNTLYICQLASRSGIKVLLSGAGGDDIFTGYRRHYALTLERYWDWLPLFARVEMRRFGNRLSKRSVGGRRFAKAFQFAHLNGNRRIAGYFQWLSPEFQDLVLSDETKSRGGIDPAHLLVDAVSAMSHDMPALNRMLYLDSKFFLADHNLNYTDKMSMAAGVEVRVPLLDLDLVSFAARLPLEFKQRGAVGKWIFKKAMERDLPHDVIYRPKTGFGVPLRFWLRGKSGECINDYLSEESIRRRGIFDVAGVRRLIEADRLGQVDAAYSILAMACIEIWLRRFVDSRLASV